MFRVESNDHPSALLGSAARLVLVVATTSLLSLSACSEAAESNLAKPVGDDSQSQSIAGEVAPRIGPPEFSSEDRSLFTVPPRGRLTIEHAKIKGRSEIPLILTIHDEGSPTDSRKTRVVAVVGKRFDGDAIPIPGEPNHFEVRVPATFLEVGLYMIEVDAVDSHPIDMRRFVVEVRP